MRIIAIGCEYTGKTTLFDGLMKWGDQRGIHHHLDDHFSIPDCQMLRTEDDQKIMLGLPETIKERFQRFQVAYHVRLINKYEHILLGGFHIEEAIYGPRYYYPKIGRLAETPRAWEVDMPSDTILVHLKASPEVIAARMKKTPHQYPIIKKKDISNILSEFQQEYRATWIKRKFEIDTSDLSPEELLEKFLKDSVSHLDVRDHMIRMNT